MEAEKRTPDHFRNGGGREAPGFPGSFSLEALLEKAPAAVILTSRDGRVLYCNEALLRLTGYGRDEVRRMSAQSVYCCLEDRERFISELRRRGSVETMETVLTRKDGRLIRGRFSSVLVATEPEEIIFSVIEDCTELRRLKGETQLQAEMLASSVAAIATFDLEGRLTYVNPAGLQLFGYDGLEEMLGRPALSFTRSPGDAERILDAVRAFGAWEGRLTVLKRDGAPFEIAVSGRLSRDCDGGPPCIILSFMDISPLLRAEAELRESERRYRAIVERQTDAVCRWLPDTTLTFANDAFARLVGKPAKLLPGMRGIGFVPEDLRGELERHRADLAGRPRTVSREYVIDTPDGTRRWIHWTDTPIFDDAGRLVEFQSVGRDVTDRKRAEEALVESEKQYRGLFENTLVGIYRSTPEGRYLSVNPAMARIFGYASPEEMICEVTDMGRQLYVDPAERDSGLKRLERTDRLVSFEVRLRRRDGSTLWGLINSRAVRDEAGAIRYIEGVLVDITTLKETEEALRSSEERFFRAFSSSPAAMTIATVDGAVYLDVNERFLEMMGYAREELIGRSSMEMGVWGDPRDREDLVRRLRRDGFVRNAPVRRRRKDGRDVHILWSASIIRLGEVEALLATHIDITDRYEAEQKLRASEERFSKAFLFNPAPMVISTIERGVFIDVNESFTNMLGYSRNCLIGSSALELGIWDDPAAREECLRTLVHDGRVRDRLVRLVTKSGEIRDVLFSAEIINLGDTKYMLSLLQDITDRKKLERELRALHHRLASVIDFLPDATFVVDRDGVVTMWNRAMEEMTGVPASEMIGRGGFAYAVPFYGERRPILIDAALGRLEGDAGKYRYIERKRGHVVAEAEAPSLKGRRRVLQGTASVIPGPDGDVIGAIESIRDITEQHELGERLFRAQKLEALGSLAGGVAHDFNNLLTTIMGFTELTRMDLQEGEHAANLDQVLKAADRARKLVKQILTFSRRGESGRKPLDLANHLRGCTSMIRAMIPSTIDLRVSISGEDRSIVLIDPVHVDQIVMNLCSNAEHAMRGRTGVLEVKLGSIEHPGKRCRSNGNEQPPGRYLRLSVRDTGYGIDPALLDRIFDPFFTTKPTGEGTGLGLSVVYGIVRDHGGCIEVESRPGEGTVFHIDLPTVPAGVANQGRDEERPVAGGAARILFVDDDPAVLALGRRALETLGHRVTALQGGFEALREFRHDPGIYDLVITDLMMPGMTGTELAREILKIRADIPIVACTGYGGGASVEELDRARFRGFLTKPFTRRDLASAVRQAIDPSGGEPHDEIHPHC